MTTKYEPGTRVSEYVLEACVGTGSFGEVWRARHHVWDSEQVAIKLPTEPEYVRYLQREGVVVHGLRQENIIRVLGLDPYAEIPYLVMELVDGPSVRDVLNEHNEGLPIDVALLITRGIVRGMQVAHAANILHRDLKPGNVLLNLGGQPLTSLTVSQVKVGDFGLGFDSGDTLRSIVQSASMDRENHLVGTLAYMAPELRDGRRSPDAASDLYSIGIILFEMLTGERPVGAELPSTIRSDVPSSLDEVFRKLYARHERRYQRAEEVLEALEVGRAPAPVGPPPVPAAGSPPPLPASGPSSCPKCHEPVESDDQFCTACGYQLVGDVRRCPSCQGYPGRYDRYCVFCGTTLEPVRT